MIVAHTSVHTERNHGSYGCLYVLILQSEQIKNTLQTNEAKALGQVGSSTTNLTKPLYVGTIQHIMDKFYHTSPSGDLNGTRCSCLSIMKKGV